MTGDAELLRKAQRYLDSARLLREAGDHDSAVSRTYYAAFYGEAPADHGSCRSRAWSK
ncbi:MAG: HEPN domain-containing protein [Halochromatium sp.]